MSTALQSGKTRENRLLRRPRVLVLCCAAIVAGCVFHFGCGSPDEAPDADAGASSTTSIQDSGAPSAPQEQANTASTPHPQTQAERIYQLESQAMGNEMFVLEETLYECWGVNVEKGLPADFTEENKATVAEVAKQANELWANWKDKLAPSTYCEALHGYALQYLQHFAEGARQMSIAFAEEDLEKFLLSIEEFKKASDAKMNAMSEGEKVAREQGL